MKKSTRGKLFKENVKDKLNRNTNRIHSILHRSELKEEFSLFQ